MRLLFSSPLAAASLLVVACAGPPSVSVEPSPPVSTPTASATQAPDTPTRRPTPTPTPSPSPTPEVSARLLSSEPVLIGDDLDLMAAPGYFGATLPATYFTADGTEHLYIVGFGPGYGVQRAFHASSADGLEWTVDVEDPLAAFVHEFSPPGPVPGTVIQNEDGGWVMYFWGVPAPLPDGAQIYRATRS